MSKPQLSSSRPDQTGNWSTNFSSELDRKIWITKGARFNAYRRLRRQHELSLRAISFLSAYLIVGSIILLMPDIGLTEWGRRWAGLGTVAMSIFILVLSLLESSKNAQLRAEVHHRCGVDLAALYDQLRIAITTEQPDPGTLQGFARAYSDVLVRSNENHEPQDDLLFRAQHQIGIKPMRARVVYWFERFRIAGFYWTLILVPPISAAVLLYLSWG
jgi:hypothetical protein